VAPCLDSHVVAAAGPMSTASPDTCADVLGVATHRAASISEPYLAIASSSSCSWYFGERQPLSTENVTRSRAASVAAWRRARWNAGSRLATAGYSSSKTVTPSGTTPSASPSARGGSPGRLSCRGCGRGSAPAMGDVADDAGAAHDW